MLQVLEVNFVPNFVSVTVETRHTDKIKNKEKLKKKTTTPKQLELYDFSLTVFFIFFKTCS